MKTRIRQLSNDKWIVEAKEWNSFKWYGIYICNSSETKLPIMIWMGVTGNIVKVNKGGLHYPLCWHDTKEQATNAENVVKAIWGK